MDQLDKWLKQINSGNIQQIAAAIVAIITAVGAIVGAVNSSDLSSSKPDSAVNSPSQVSDNKATKSIPATDTYVGGTCCNAVNTQVSLNGETYTNSFVNKYADRDYTRYWIHPGNKTNFKLLTATLGFDDNLLVDQRPAYVRVQATENGKEKLNVVVRPGEVKNIKFALTETDKLGDKIEFRLTGYNSKNAQAPLGGIAIANTRLHY